MTRRIVYMAAMIIISFIVLFFILAAISKSGKPAGLINNKLTPCPSAPHCVCSEFSDDPSHFITPLSLSSRNIESALSVARNTIEQQGGKIITQENNYLAAEFSSDFFGFVDDVEIRLDYEHHQLHLRSSSRMGYSDMGVNKNRAAMLMQRFKQQLTL